MKWQGIAEDRKSSSKVISSCKIISFCKTLCLLTQTHLTPKLPSHRNQSIDFQSKPSGWFLYDDNFGD